MTSFMAATVISALLVLLVLVVALITPTGRARHTSGGRTVRTILADSARDLDDAVQQALSVGADTWRWN